MFFFSEKNLKNNCVRCYINTLETQGGFVSGSGKIISIKDAILTDIRNGVFKPGDRIPSRLRCMERFSCARASIDRAISELIASGELYAHHGSGTFVSHADREIPEIKRLYIAAFLENSRINYFVPGSPEDELRDFLPTTLVDWRRIRLFLEKLSTPGCAVLWKYPRYQELDVMQYLYKAHIPQILIGRDYEPYNFITVDPESGLKAGLDFLTADGGRDIGFVHSGTDLERHFIAERQLIFYRMLLERELHLPARYMAIASRNPKNQAEEMNCAVQKLLNTDSPCRLIYLECANWYHDFIRAAAKLGRIPGRDFRLLVYDHPVNTELPAGVAAICQDYGRINAVVKSFLKAHGQTEIKMRLKPVLKIGGN